MAYQRWEDLLDDDEGDQGPTSDGPLASTPAGVDADDPQALLREVPELAQLLEQRSALERRMKGLLGQGASDDDDPRQRLRFPVREHTAQSRLEDRRMEQRDLETRLAALQRLARQRLQRRAEQEQQAHEQRRREHRVQRRRAAQAKRREQAQQQRQAHQAALVEQRRQEQRDEATAQRLRLRQQDERALQDRAGGGATLRSRLDSALDRGRQYSDALRDRVRDRGWNTQREQLRDQLRDQRRQLQQAAAADPELARALKEDDDLRRFDEGLGRADRALSTPDTWAEQRDAIAKRAQRTLTVPEVGARVKRGLRLVEDSRAFERARERLRELQRARHAEQHAQQRAEQRRNERKSEQRRERRRDRREED